MINCSFGHESVAVSTLNYFSNLSQSKSSFELAYARCNPGGRRLFLLEEFLDEVVSIWFCIINGNYFVVLISFLSLLYGKGRLVFLLVWHFTLRDALKVYFSFFCLTIRKLLLLLELLIVILYFCWDFWRVITHIRIACVVWRRKWLFLSVMIEYHFVSVLWT